MGLFSKKPYEDPFRIFSSTISIDKWNSEVTTHQENYKDGVLLSPMQAGGIEEKRVDANNEDSAYFLLNDVFQEAIFYKVIININDNDPIEFKNQYHYIVKAAHSPDNQENIYRLLNTKTKNSLGEIRLPYSEILVTDEYLFNPNTKDAHLHPVSILKKLIEKTTEFNHLNS